ncbi:hypothetical protein [Actinacidiphila glaucinigra]|uniref:hypothetical protein n=1 Tax=Actinacidiphila glaucinigra TaxID=235986 RepID=UPI0035D9804A
MSDFGSSYIERAWEPPEEVVMQRSVVETCGMQPEDVGVLAALLLRDPGRPATAKAMAADLRGLGWKMSLDRFQKVVERLTAAGHMHRESVFNQQTGRPEWVSRVYRNPANNAGYATGTATASSQVSNGIGENPTSGSEGRNDIGENPISPGQSDIGENPIPGANSGKTRFRDRPVSAGQSQNQGKPDFAASPPTPPPEEVDTSSPSPLTAVGGRFGHDGPAARGEAEEVEFTADELAAAGDFLQELPSPWAVGRPTAARYAPLLLESVRAQGWDLDEDLVRELTKNPDGIRNYGAALKTRIRDLVRRKRSRTPAAGGPPAWRGHLLGDEPGAKRSGATPEQRAAIWRAMGREVPGGASGPVVPRPAPAEDAPAQSAAPAPAPVQEPQGAKPTAATGSAGGQDAEPERSVAQYLAALRQPAI